MEEKEALQIFNEVGAIITDGHFVYASGKHGKVYINKDAIYPRTAHICRLCYAIAEKFANDNINVVAAPAVGGVILSQWVAHFLSQIDGYEVLSIYAEKSEDSSFVFRRGYNKLISGRNILVVEDVITTGNSVKKVIEAVRVAGGNVVGVGALCNSAQVTAQDIGNVPRLRSLVNMKLDTWDLSQCPLCKQNIPINTEFGRGNHF